MRQPWWPRIDTNSGSEESGSDRVVSSLAATNAGQMQLADSEAGLTHKELTFEHTWNYLVCTVLIEGMLMPGGGQHTAARQCPDVLVASATHVNLPCPAGALSVQDIRHQCSDAHRRPQDLNTSIVLAAKHLCVLKPLQGIARQRAACCSIAVPQPKGGQRC